jgi:hypothetical protein
MKKMKIERRVSSIRSLYLLSSSLLIRTIPSFSLIRQNLIAVACMFQKMLIAAKENLKENLKENFFTNSLNYI